MYKMSWDNGKKIVDQDDLQGSVAIQEEGVSPVCADCDTNERLASDAQTLAAANDRIKELEEQVAIMTVKATSAGQ